MDRVQIRLVAIWAVLIGLLGLTVVASFLLQGVPSVAASLGIALAKAGLIFWFFMRLRSEGGLMRLAATGAAIWLVVLLSLVSVDYLTR
jgi:cytochrome c oxidase subunit 4